MLAVGLHEMNARERPKIVTKGLRKYTYIYIHLHTDSQLKQNCPIPFLSAGTRVHLDEDNLV